MALYYIGKSEKDIFGCDKFAGSETIFGTNQNENYAKYSIEDEEKDPTKLNLSNVMCDLRFAMEKFKFLDNDAKFVFLSKDLYEEVMKISEPEMIVSASDIKVVESLDEI
jgi:hypothetical protein